MKHVFILRSEVYLYAVYFGNSFNMINIQYYCAIQYLSADKTTDKYFLYIVLKADIGNSIYIYLMPNYIIGAQIETGRISYEHFQTRYEECVKWLQNYANLYKQLRITK